jgi:hypothetical protein
MVGFGVGYLAAVVMEDGRVWCWFDYLELYGTPWRPGNGRRGEGGRGEGGWTPFLQMLNSAFKVTVETKNNLNTQIPWEYYCMLKYG